MKISSVRHSKFNRILAYLILTVVLTITLYIFYTTSEVETKLPYERPVKLSLLDPIKVFDGELIQEAKKCFEPKHNTEHIQLLDDILEAKRKPTLGKSIFFHETSCSEDGSILLSSRQGCAVESTAKLNPGRDVFVLFTAIVGHPKQEPISPVINALLSYPNIQFRNLNLETYATNTPAATWLATGELFLFRYLKFHTSEFVRFLSLYRFGGFALDWNVIARRSFDELPPNYANETFALLSLQHDSVGRRIAELLLREFYENFDGTEERPDVLTRVLKRICDPKEVNEFSSDFCNDLSKLQLIHPLPKELRKECISQSCPKVFQATTGHLANKILL